MSRRHLLLWCLPGLILLAGSCSERLDVFAPQVQAPGSLSATVNDTLWFTGTYLGNGRDVARHDWDFNSDGIFDFEWVNNGGWGGTVHARHVYSRAGDYTATLQITTVDNRLYRSFTSVQISDELPVIEAEVPDSADCGETLQLWGRAEDDAGLRAYWDLDSNGAPEISQAYLDSIVLTATVSFPRPGSYSVTFGASDNDGHNSQLSFPITVGFAPEWTGASPLTEPRADHAAVAYGDEIVVFGGRHQGSTLGSVEIYDPVSDSWRSGRAMPTPRWGMGAVVVRDSVYVVGGVDGQESVFRGVEIYHPPTDSWRSLPAEPRRLMPIPKRGFSTLQIGDKTAAGDSLLIFGGIADGALSDTLIIYNTRVDTFSLDKTANHYMQQTRAWMGAVTAWQNEQQLNGRMIALGGSPGGAMASGAFEIYLPSNDFWTGEAAMPTPRIAPALAHHAGKLYVFGGSLGAAGATDVTEIFYLDEEHWQIAEPMPLARSGAQAIVMGGRIYVIGGATPDTTPYYVEGSSEVQALIPWRCSR